MKRRLLGYWRNEEHPEYPEPGALVDRSWNSDERETVETYLQYGSLAVAFMGYSTCRICGVDNGSLELTDGVYQWPEGLTHYLAEHQVRLPREFIDHAIESQSRLEAPGSSSDEWWLSTNR